jgi:hypothetical protein
MKQFILHVFIAQNNNRNFIMQIHTLLSLVSLTQREVCRLRVFENRGLREIFGPKGNEVTGEWRRLHNEELNDLYSLLNIIQVTK